MFSYILTDVPAGLVGAYVFDGHAISPVQPSGQGQYLFTKLA